MAKRMSVYGAGGTPRHVTKFGVYGAGGLLRNVKAAWVYGAGGTPRQFFSSGSPVNLSGTLTGVVDGSITGYRDGLEGDLTPAITFANGGRVSQIYSANAANSITLRIDNLVANPGQSFFSTLEFNDGIHILNSASASYSFASNTASWVFTSTLKLTGSRLMEIFL